MIDYSSTVLYIALSRLFTIFCEFHVNFVSFVFYLKADSLKMFRSELFETCFFFYFKGILKEFLIKRMH